jgi:hypothetical protein
MSSGSSRRLEALLRLGQRDLLVTLAVQRQERQLIGR